MANDNVLELLFKLSTKDDGGLDKAEAAIKKIAAASGYTGRALDVMEGEVRKAFNGMAGAGLNFEQIIKRLGQSSSAIGKEPAAAARELTKELQAATAAAKNLENRQRDLTNAGSGLQNAIRNPFAAVEAAATRTASALGPLGIAFAAVGTAAALGGKAMFDLVEAQGKEAEQLGNLATRLGLTVNQASQLSAAAAIAGVNIGSLTASTRYLSAGLEDSVGTGKRTATALREMGVSVQDASGNQREMGQVMLDVIEKLSSYDNVAKRAYLSTQILGRGAREIQPLIDQYKDLKKTVQELGFADVEQLNANLQKADDEIDKLGLSWKLFKAKLAEEISPIVIPVVTSLRGLLTDPLGKKEIEAAEKRNYGTKYAGEGDFLGRLSIPADVLRSAIPRGDTADTDAGGLALARQQINDSLAGGKRISESFLSNRANTDEGRTQRLEEIGKRLQEITGKLSAGGLVQPAAEKFSAEASSLEREKKQIQDAQSRSRQSESEIRRLREDSKYPGLQSPVEFQKLIAERQKTLDLVGKGNEGIVDAKYLPKIQEAIRKFFDSVGRATQKEAEKTVKDSERRSPFELQNKEFQRDLKDKISVGEAQFNETKKQLAILNSSDRDSAKQQQSRAIRVAELQGGPGNELAAIGIGTQSRVDSANALRSDSLAQIKDLEDSINSQSTKSVDDQKQLAQIVTDRLRVEAEYRKEIDDARFDAEIRIGELQKRQLDEYRQEAFSLYDALRRPNGIKEFFKGQVDSLAGGIFANVTGPILQKIGQQVGGLIPGQTGANGQKNGLGKIFAGTILDSDRAATPQLKAIDGNTAALNKLTATISGTSIGGQSSAVPGGLPDAIATATKTGAGAGASSGSGGGFFSDISKALGLGGSTISKITKLGAGGAGIYEAINQFGKHNGASGIVGGIGAATGTAALFDPEPISKGILGAISIGAELFKSILPDPKQYRSAQIANQTQYSTYVAPPTLNRNLSASGTETFTDKYGRPQVSGFSSIQETQPYKYQDPTRDPNSLYQNWQTRPGQIIEPYQAPPPTPNYAANPAGVTINTNLTIQALDSKSILDRSSDIATAVQREVRNGHGVGLSLQQALVGT